MDRSTIIERIQARESELAAADNQIRSLRPAPRTFANQFANSNLSPGVIENRVRRQKQMRRGVQASRSRIALDINSMRKEVEAFDILAASGNV